MVYKEKLKYLDPNKRQGIIDTITAIISNKQEIAFAFLFGSFLDGYPFRDIWEPIDRLRALCDMSQDNFLKDRDKQDIASLHFSKSLGASLLGDRVRSHHEFAPFPEERF